jgi:hypothetical protein
VGFNIENLLVKANDRDQVVECVRRFWGSGAPHLQPDWELPSSFEAFLAREPKRKIAISPVVSNWTALVESKEVVDFALAKTLSVELNTTAIVVQLYEVTGLAGYAVVNGGQVAESYSSETDADPLSVVISVCGRYEVPFKLISFDQAVRKRAEGWTIVSKA